MVCAAMKPTKPGLKEPHEQIHNIRITLSSKNVKNLEKVCADLVRGAKDKRLRVKNAHQGSSLPHGNLYVVKEQINGIDLSFVFTSKLLTFSVPHMW
ncbi:hypothetical protein V6N13_050813 [Hibiscus sabdariffa]|uniref:Ribosomal protein S10 domain-containing protein n=1 Tax=Hibiscus sabdariffa TaxID=183260 RepID=A0ABR2PIE8_9ROSI